MASECYIMPHGSFGDDVLDLSAGAGVTTLGHSNELIKDVMEEQLALLPYAHSATWTCEAVEQAALMLLDASGFKNGGVMFLNSGAESVEAACKLAVQFFSEVKPYKEAHPVRFISRQHSFHGNTFFTLALGDHPRKNPYRLPVPLMDELAVWRMPAWDPSWRGDDLAVEPYMMILRNFLAAARIAETPAVVVVETIGGTTLGIEPPSADYLLMIKTLCAEFGAVLIFDEVLCGNYRTGHCFAWQHYGVEPDIICVGKGIGGGYFPISAVIANERIAEACRTGSGKLWHSSTNQNSPIGCAAIVAASLVYKHTERLRNRLMAHLQTIAVPTIKKWDRVQDVVGVGTLWGIRLRRGPDYSRLRERALKQGVALYVDNDTAGTGTTSILLAPAYVMTEKELDEGLQLLRGTLEDID
jgi:adenosylmethionine-8-amino-7-oxononanoate aminotransferase